MRSSLLIPLVLGLAATKLALDHVADVDLFWHLRLGEEMLTQGALPTSVGYSWTLAGSPYLANDWLAQIALTLAFRGGEFVGVAIFKAVAVVGLGLLMYAASLKRAQGNARAAGLAAGVMLFVAASEFIARPLLLGHLCLAAELLAIEAAMRGRARAAWWLPVIFAIWINVHGSWPVGLGPLVAAAGSVLLPVRWGRLGSRDVPAPVRKALLAGLALAPLGLLANPMGLALLTRPFRLVGRQSELHVIGEWSPVPWSDPSAWVFAGAVALLGFAFVRGRRELPLYDLGLLAVTLVMAATTALYHLAFAIIAAPILAEQLAGLVSSEGMRNRRLNAAIAVASIVLFGVIGAARLAGVAEDVRRSAPMDAVAALEQRGVAQQAGFNYFDWGGYLVFRGIPTFIDGRLEPFLEAGIFDEYIGIERRGDAEAVEARGAQWVLIPPHTRLAAAMDGRAGWRVAFRDATSVLWLREAGLSER